MSARTRRVCPICGEESLPRVQNAASPFCSASCKLVDLGYWLDGAYRIPGSPVESVEAAEDGQDPSRRDEE